VCTTTADCPAGKTCVETCCSGGTERHCVPPCGGPPAPDIATRACSGRALHNRLNCDGEAGGAQGGAPPARSLGAAAGS
jgi:hypothetical protein